MVTVEGLREYSPNYEESDGVISLCLEAAKAYAAGAGVPMPETDNPRYDLLVYMIASHWDYNRGIVSDAKNEKIQLSVDSLILQLR